MFPTLFEIGDFQLSTFGVMVALAMIAGGELTARSFEREGLSRDDAWTMVLVCAVAGLVGAKLWYAGEQFARGTPGDFLFDHLLARSGLTWYGGFTGGLIAALIAVLIKRLPWFTVVNCAAPTLPIAQAIGRIGCFLVGDDYGRVSDVPWAVAFPKGSPPTEEPVHPTMLYESAWLLALGLILWRRRGRSPFLLGEYLVVAGAGRLWIEALRVNPVFVGPFSNAQVTSLAMVLAGAIGWFYFRARGTPAAPGPLGSG